ncbi:MAG: hypothetical protein OXE95_05570 [Chloroflexi bacterium]|nr:hypothetical protein [Chloroflexota bacterium]
MMLALAALPGAADGIEPDWFCLNPAKSPFNFVPHIYVPERGHEMVLYILPDMGAIGKWWHAEAVINKQRQVVWNNDWQLEIRYNRRNGKPVKIIDDSYSRLQELQVLDFEVYRSPYDDNYNFVGPSVTLPHFTTGGDYFCHIPWGNWEKSYSRLFVVTDEGFADNQRVTAHVWARNTKTGERVRIGKYKARTP